MAERFGSDLWVRGDFAYTGTWGNRGGNRGDALKIWQLSSSGAPTLIDSIVVEGITTVSDVEVSDNGNLLVFSAEGQTDAGLYVYRLTDPRRPTRVGYAQCGAGHPHRVVRQSGQPAVCLRGAESVQSGTAHLYESVGVRFTLNGDGRRVDGQSDSRGEPILLPRLSLCPSIRLPDCYSRGSVTPRCAWYLPALSL